MNNFTEEEISRWQDEYIMLQNKKKNIKTPVLPYKGLELALARYNQFVALWNLNEVNYQLNGVNGNRTFEENKILVSSLGGYIEFNTDEYHYKFMLKKSFSVFDNTRGMFEGYGFCRNFLYREHVSMVYEITFTDYKLTKSAQKFLN